VAFKIADPVGGAPTCFDQAPARRHLPQHCETLQIDGAAARSTCMNEFSRSCGNLTGPMSKDSAFWPSDDPLFGRFLRFVLVGGFCASLNLLILWFTTSWIGWHYFIGITLSFFGVNWIGLVLNNRFTFSKDSRPHFGKLKRYYSVMFASLFLNFVMMRILVDTLGINYLLSSVLVTLIFAAFNFFAHQAWTFSVWSRTDRVTEP
jgi:putative flippase GtrA